MSEIVFDITDEENGARSAPYAGFLEARLGQKTTLAKEQAIGI
jgi:hypothetical protein